MLTHGRSRWLQRGIALTFLGVMGLGTHGWGVLAAELKDIQSRGYLIVGVKDNFSGLGKRQPDDSLKGFEIDLAREISKKLLGQDTKIELIPLLNRDRLPKVMNDEVDLAIANVTVTDARLRLVAFSPPYLSSRTAFITTRPNIRTLAQLSGEPIGVLQQSVAIGRLRSRFPQAQLVGLTSYAEAQEKLASGSLTTFAGDDLVLRSWQGDLGQDLGKGLGKGLGQDRTLHLLEQGLGYSAIGIVLPKGVQYESLRQGVSQALADLEQSGWLQQKRKEWGVSKQPGTGLDSLDKE